jgi:uncharacterized RDD family membrane protein YckC
MNRQVRVYAGLLPRFWALLIDLALFVSLFLPATRLVKGVWIMNATDHRWAKGLFITDPLCIAFLIVMLFYFVILEGLEGGTLGKLILGLRVINADDGSKPGLTKSLVRNLFRFVDGLPALNILGIVLIVRSPQHARFGDRVADTRVVNLRADR